MLRFLSIDHFALIQHLELDFQTGMTVITGETGVGKSILLDALSICLGARAETSLIRHGQKQAEISALFDIEQRPEIIAWLQQQECLNEDEPICVLRRIMTQDSRSRCYINGKLVTQQLLAELGNQLVDIHSQHHNQALLKKDYHLTVLDEFADHDDLLQKVKKEYHCYLEIRKKLQVNITPEKQDWLQYQLDELSALQLQAGEFQILEEKIKTWHQAEKIKMQCHEVLQLGEAQPNILYQMQNGVKKPEIKALFEQARILIEEGLSEVEHYLKELDLDDQDMILLEQKFDQIHQLARKHRVQPEELIDLINRLQTELDEIKQSEAKINALQQELQHTKEAYFKAANALSTSRKSAAKKLSEKIQQQLKQLGFLQNYFEVSFQALSATELYLNGQEQVEFLISFNPGQPMQPLNKIASGGELSRVALAIRVMQNQLPTLVFDEVDTGMSGQIAAVVGKLIHAVSKQTQVLCITHLAQVASLAEHHFNVTKKTDGKETFVEITNLTGDQRIHEIARMLGGIKITEQTLAHAKELIS